MVDSPDDKASGTQGPHQWPGSRCFDTGQSPLDAVQVSRSGLRSDLRWFCTFGLPKPLPGLTYHHPYIGGICDAMLRGIDRSPASTLLGLAPLALTAWIGKFWTRLPQGHGHGGRPGRSDLLFLCLAWLASAVSRGGEKLLVAILPSHAKARKSLGCPPRESREYCQHQDGTRSLYAFAETKCSAFRIVTKTMVQTKSNFEKGETYRLDRRYLRVAN